MVNIELKHNIRDYLVETNLVHGPEIEDVINIA